MFSLLASLVLCFAGLVSSYPMESKGLCNNYQEGAPKTRGGAYVKIMERRGGSTLDFSSK